jgi:hypothetical protein
MPISGLLDLGDGVPADDDERACVAAALAANTPKGTHSLTSCRPGRLHATAGFRAAAMRQSTTPGPGVLALIVNNADAEPAVASLLKLDAIVPAHRLAEFPVALRVS